jgi:hypothetical protein
MVLTVSSTREFVPKFNGNKELSVSDQIRVNHNAPTMSIKEKVMPRGFDFDKDGQVSTHVEIDRKKMFKAFDMKIVNLAYEKPIDANVSGPVKVVGDNKTIVKVQTSEDLFNAPVEFDPLIDELYEYFQNLLNTKVDEKN